MTQTALRALSHAFRFGFGLMVSLWPYGFALAFAVSVRLHADPRSVFPAPQGTGEEKTIFS